MLIESKFIVFMAVLLSVHALGINQYSFKPYIPPPEIPDHVYKKYENFVKESEKWIKDNNPFKGDAISETYVMIAKKNLLKNPKAMADLKLMDFSNKLYLQSKQMSKETGKPLDYGVLRDVLARAKAQYQKEVAIIENSANYTPGKGWYFIDILSDAFFSQLKVKPLTKEIGEAIAKIALQELKDNYTTFKKIKKQREYTDEYLKLYENAENIIREHDYINQIDSIANEQISKPLFSLSVKAVSGDSVEKNLDMDPEFKEQKENSEILQILRKSITLDGKVKLSDEDQEKIKEIVKEEINEVLASSKESQAAIKTLLSIEADKRKKEIEATEKSLKYETANSVVFLVSSLVGISDPESARAIQMVGTSVIQFATVLDKFQTTLSMANIVGSTIMGIVNFAAGIGQIVGNLISFFANVKTPEQLILEGMEQLSHQIEQLSHQIEQLSHQIEQLSDQIALMHQDMHDRFNRVDLNINRLFLAMQEGFNELNKKLASMNYNLYQIENSVAGIRETLSRLDMATYLYLKSGFYMPVIENIDICLSENPYMTRAEFHNCLQRFKTYATKHAANALSTGATDAVLLSQSASIDASALVFESLGEQLTKGLWNNIAVIAGLVENRYGIRPARTSLVNGEEWAAYVDSYVAFLAEHPNFMKYFPEETLAVTNSILKAGDDIESFSKNLGMSVAEIEKVDEKKNEKNTALTLALKDYENFYSLLKKSILSERSRFQAYELKGYGLIPFYKKTSEITIPSYIHTFDSIPPCETYKEIAMSYNGFTQGPDIPFALIHGKVELDLSKILPSEVLLAYIYGLGDIRLCYCDVGWENIEDKHIKTDEHKFLGFVPIIVGKTFRYETYGNLSMSINFEFIPKNTNRNLTVVRGLIKSPIKTPFYRHSKCEGNCPLSLWLLICPPSSSKFKTLLAHTLYEQWPQMATKFKEFFIPYKVVGLENIFELLFSGAVPRAVPKAVPRAVPRSEVAKMLEAFLDDQRTIFSNRIRERLFLGGDVARYANALVGAKRVLESILFLAYPDSIVSNDELRSFFYGENALTDREELINSWNMHRIKKSDKLETKDNKTDVCQNVHSEDPFLDPEEGIYWKCQELKHSKFKEVLLNLEKDRSGKETHDVINRSKRELEILKLVYAAIVPPIPIEYVIGEIKDKLDNFK